MTLAKSIAMTSSPRAVVKLGQRVLANDSRVGDGNVKLSPFLDGTSGEGGDAGRRPPGRWAQRQTR